jgi:hypothetical protein
MKSKIVNGLSGWQRLLYWNFPFSLLKILEKYRCRRLRGRERYRVLSSGRQ